MGGISAPSISAISAPLENLDRRIPEHLAARNRTEFVGHDLVELRIEHLSRAIRFIERIGEMS
jgi:hypothetical protein